MTDSSDEATGLPPLDEIGTDPAMIVLAWSSTEGLVSSPHAAEPVAVRFLHLRGLIEAIDEVGGVEWTQVHIAVPTEHAMDVAAALVRDVEPVERAADRPEPETGARLTCGCWRRVIAGTAIGDRLRCSSHGPVQVFAVNVPRPE